MCGFVAIYNDPAVNDKAVDSMCDLMVLRGPDYFGKYRDPDMTMGHRRLSIIDLSDQANQPMTVDSCVIVFNGEIYNYLELRAELEGKYGRIFKTKSDTEVIVHSYLVFGPECVSRFNGMFSFVIWNFKTKEAFVARDRLGIKPLYFKEKDGAVYFASDPKSLWVLFPVSQTLNKDSLYNFFINKGIVSEETSGAGIRRFPPGHWARISQKQNLQPVKYWDLLDTKKTSLSFDEAVLKTEELFKDAVKLRLRSDVPVGCFLSGGIDSSLISATAAESFGQKLNSYSVGFDQASFDESAYAYSVAEKFGLHHKHQILDSSCLEFLPGIVWDFSELCGDESSVPSYFVSKWAKESLKVVMTGDGADEAFGGYLHYFASYTNGFYKKFVPFFARKGFQAIASLMPDSVHAIANCRKINAMSFMDTAEAFAMINNSYSYKSFSDQCMRQNGKDVISAITGPASGLSSVDAMTYTDIQYYLINKYLPKIDFATMAHSLEARSPFLDYRLFELGFSLPDNVKFRCMTRKAVLKKLASKYFPRSFVYRKKGGFSPPINSWLMQSKYEQIVRRIILRESCLYELFRKQEVAGLINEFYRGNQSHFRKIWLFLWFQIWEGVFVSKCFSKDSLLSDLGT